ncbi:MAG TPA: non-ribosomal peptide synthase/polyketide synthase, partial [Kofleriaceae bacterium]|nr:non-ribosomal peptide synthase/polyketide synthase [Kofleriaceae bacterium]
MIVKSTTLHRLLEARAAAPSDTFEGHADDAGRPLSFAQQRLWFLQQLAPNDTAYNAPFAQRLRGPLDVEALRRAIEHVIQRHEALRTAFPSRDGVPRQIVYQLVRLELHVTSLASIDAAEREAAVAQLIGEEAARPFDLGERPPLRTWLLRLAEDEHVLVFTLHHVLIDEASFQLMWREVTTAYAALVAGQEPALPPVKVQYPDYAAKQRARITDAVLKRHLAFWTHQLTGAPARTELPYRHARVRAAASPPREYLIDLGAETTRALRDVAKQGGTTLFMTGLAALRAVLARTTGQEDLCIGAPISTRNRPELRQAIGFFVNTLALRTPLDMRAGFAALLRRERETMLDAFERQETPFEMIVNALGLERDATSNPLFQISFTHHPASEDAPRLGPVEVSSYTVERSAAQFDLEVETSERGESLEIRLSYKSELFEPWVIEGLAHQLACFLREAVRAPELPIARVPLVDEGERGQLIDRWSAPEHEANDLTLRELFEHQVDRTPEATALVLGDARLTYRELDERANRIAAALRAHDVGPEQVVGVALERSFDQVAAIIGVIKTGGAWVPLAPTLPTARLRYIAEVSRARAVVTSAEHAREIGELALPIVDVTSPAVTAAASGRFPVHGVTADHLAYVLFTSGSTGQPKGVMVTHRGIRNELAVSNHALLPMGPGEALLALAPFTFDQSVHEMWWPLVNGATLVLVAEGEQRDPQRVVERIQQGNVTVLELVPTLLRTLVADRALARCPSLRLVAAGGEALTLDLMRAFYAAYPELGLINGYGPTETAVTVCNWRCVPEAEAMVIGDAWANVQFRVLDDHGEPVPLGVAGELFIGGLQLARGYASRPDLTAERFVPDPYATEPGRRMYRTGDRVRRLPDGTIEFLGRVDAQVKLRGFRIELGEIEAAILANEAVAQCAVAIRPSARGEQLVAYLVLRSPIEIAALRGSLAGQLPEYMIPAAYVELEALPLTPSGKLDRRGLPAPSEDAFERAPMVAPRTPDEEAIAKIWREVLGIEEVGVRDDFFARGGHSLLAVQVVARIRTELDATITLAQLFRTPTIEGLAQEISQRTHSPGPAPAAVTAVRSEPLLLSYAQQRLWLVDQMSPGGAYHMPSGRRLQGALDVEALRRAFEDIVRRHEILRTVFPSEDGLPRQQILPLDRWELPLDDLSALAPDEREAQLARISREDAEARFDLATGPLVRTRLVRLAPDDHVVLVTMHHIVSDGTSYDVFWREVIACYEDNRHGRPHTLAALPLQYADYAAQQRAAVSGDALEAHLAYWKRHLAGAPAETALPRRSNRAATQGHAGSLVFTLDAATTRTLRELGKREGATLFMILLAAFRAVLARTSGQDDLVIGTPISGRDRPELEGLIGLFVNTLVLRNEVDRTATFAQLVRRERETVLAAHAHQDAPFEMIVDELGIDRRAARSPIFQIWFVQESVGGTRSAFGDALRDDVFSRELSESKFELSVYLNETRDGVEVALLFDTGVFARHVIDGIGDRFRAAIELAARTPDRSFAELELGAPPPGSDPRVAIAKPAYPYVLDVVDELARAMPDAPALRHAGRELTRSQLWAASTGVVDALTRAGIQPGDRVALAGPPSVGLIAGYLGILRHGACMVPLSSRLSREHVERLLEHVGARVILEATGGTPRASTRVPTAAIDHATGAVTMPAAVPASTRPTDPAVKYIYFTSGTTGAQKGVIGNLVALGHFSAWQRAQFSDVAGPVSAQLTELGFDVFLRDTMFALTSGKVMALPPNEVAELEPVELLRWLEREGVTAIHSVPSLLRTWLNAAPSDVSLRALRCIFLVGEPLDATLVERWRARFGAHTEIVNLYGTTETGPAKCWYRVPHPPEPGIQPAGWPLPETQILVMRDPRSLAAIGEVGEVVIRTPFSSLGYLDAPAGDEAPRFFANPFRSDPDDRLYRTGDLGRYRADGAVEIIGRSDDQVKLRGQRVDPSGIAAALRSHRGVADGAVIAAKLSADDVRLIAYVVRAEPAPSTADLREHLRQTMPPYMIPSSFVFLTALPRKANGKLDRAALPAPDWDAGDEDMFVPPRSPEEETIAAIWRDVLNIEKVGVRDDFFALGGHSLLAVLVTSRLRALLEVDVGIQRFFEAPTIEGLAANIVRLRAGAQSNDAPPPIVAVPRTGELPLSFAQQRLWFLHRLAPTSPAYHVPLQRRIRGRLAVEALRRAFEVVVHRHESLRTVFPSAGGVPLQRITEPARWELPVEDLGGVTGAEREAALESALRDHAERPFDLATGPLFRTKLVRLADDDHVVLVTLHHIISDGWSMSVMWTEVADLYRHYATGAPSRLPALPIQYADYAAWQRAWLSGATLERQLAYWIDQLRDAPSETALPLKGPRPAVSSARGGMVAFELDAELASGIKALNKATRSTNFVTLLAAFRSVFARISGQDDLCIGSPIASRNRHELEHVIGIVLNTLVLRTPIVPAESFTELVKRERANALAAYAHQEAPFEMIVDALKIERSLNRTPLFQISFVHQNLPQAPPAIGDLADETFNGAEITTRFDLSIVSFERDAKIQIELVYNVDLFDRWQIEQLAAQFLHFLREALREPARPVASIPIVSAAERAQLATAWSQPAETTPRELTIPAMFEAQVDRTPDATALVFGDAQLRYRELDESANRIAHALRERGVGPETIVGISLERSFELVAAILGVGKAGGAWVPLDPHLPAARLAAISEVARPAVVIDVAWLARVASSPASRPAPITRSPDHLAYVLFTSGSTGQPKGVMIPHRGIVNELISAQTLRAQLGASDRFLQLAPYTFDLSVHEMLWPLTTGAAVVLLPEGAHREPRRILDEMRARHVTIMHPVPALLRALMAEGDALEQCADLRIMCSGGEALPLDVLRAFTARRPDVTLINSYGPTETSVTVSGWRARPDATGVAIGLPYLGTQMYVLDERLEPAPLGVAGELYIGGEQLARGYAAQPALTAAAFVPDPFSTAPGARMYRTGDRARRWQDGNVEILGRVDRQVKLRGFRIELGEIEAVMRDYAGVREAAVAIHGAGPDARLVAYVVPASVPADELRTFLASRLPEYMVPRAVLGLDAMPLNRSGKLDRAALPVPDDAALARDRYEAPRTPLEELLAGIWSELLGVERISRSANFFDLGGHSLLAARLAWEAKTTIATVFAAPTIAGLAAAIEAQATDAATAPPAIVAVDRSQPLALSHAQQRMWFLHQLAPNSPAYHMSLGRTLRGPLDVEALRRAFEDVIARHEVLRSTFPTVEGLPRVEIRAPGTWQLPLVDVSVRMAAARDAELAWISRAETERPFDLAAGPLLRTLLVRMSPTEHVVLVTLHHIVFDGQSIGLFWHEVEELYSARVEMRPASLAALPIQYVDHAHWQRSWLTGDVLGGQLGYWKEHLRGAPEDTALPFKGPRPPVQTHHGASLALTLSRKLGARLREVTRAQGSTLFITLLAAFRALLLRYTGQDDICIGAPTANRKQREVEPLLGLFVNTVVFRTPATGTTTFAELLEQERTTALAAFAHADTPLEMVIEQLDIARSLSRNPLFQVMFQVMFADAGPPDIGLSGLTIEHVERGLISTHVDLDVSAIVEGDQIDLVFVYNTDLFEPAVIAQMTGHFEALLSAALADPELTLADLGMLAASEQDRLLHAWNRTARDVPRATLPALLAQRIASTPDAVAIEANGRTLTYRALAEQRNRLARHLVELGLAPEERVGICLDRGPDLVIAMLAVLEAGGAYLPLDSELPADRLAYMVEDARVRFVLTEPHLRDRVPAAHHVIVDFAQPPLAAQSPAPLGRPLAPEQLAYVLYTSGSTGRPKGVQIQHASLVNFLVSMLDAPGLTERDTLLAVTTASFDISGLELYLPLLSGARLVIASRDDARDGTRLMRLLDEQRVTAMQATPATWRMLVELGWRPRPGFIAMCGGEALPPDLAASLAARVGALWNLYGPTETTIWSARKRIEAGVPIRLGEPIANTQLYILDPISLRTQPLEVAGELYIAGDGLARGYGDRPELTASRFVPDPFATTRGARMYRTGDLARRLTDGELEFLGRIDHQVKIRGFRIELGEIEAVLADDPRVAEVVVVVREDGGEPRLVAYIVSLGTPPAIDALQELARARLPDYMVPAAVVFLDELPLSPAGKIDRRALPAPDRAAFGAAAYQAPRGPIEEILAGIWAQLLDVPRVGARDDFFELGGHSLLALRLVWAINQAFAIELDLEKLFAGPTIAELATAIAAAQRTEGTIVLPPIVPADRAAPLPLSYAQERMWFLHQLNPSSPAYNIATGLRLRGPLDPEALRRAFEATVARHASLRTVFPSQNGVPHQELRELARWELPIDDLSHVPAAERDAELERRSRDEGRRPFELATELPLRTRLLRFASDDHAVFATLHHIATDGWSLDLMWREVQQHYAAFTRGEQPSLAALPIQYADYAAWQRRVLAGDALAQQLAYWKRRLADAPQELTLPLKGPRPAQLTFGGELVTMTVGREVTHGLAELARRQGTTVVMAVLAAFRALLYHYTGQRDVCIGVPTANRKVREVEQLVGLFVNTVVVRTDAGPEASFLELLARERAAALEAYAHQDAPFEMVIDALHVERALNRNPLFQVLFQLWIEEDAPPEAAWGSVRADLIERLKGATQLDLDISGVVREDSIELAFLYNVDLFDRALIDQLLGHFQRLLAQVVTEPQRPIATLDLLAPEEQRKLLVGWNATDRDYSRELFVPGQIEAQVDRTPGAVAVTFEGASLTYRELDDRANRLANHLLARGVRRDQPVGVSLERSIDMVVAVIAILKTGAAYMPVDPSYPPLRVQALLEDSGCSFVVDRAWLDAEHHAIAASSSARPGVAIDGDGAAYVLFTSGSTGRPKGAVLPHAGMRNRLLWPHELGFTAKDRFLLKTPFTFDVSVFELFYPFTIGGCLVIARPDGHRDPLYLARLIDEERVTYAHFVPSMLGPFLDAAKTSPVPSLRRVICSGEALTSSLVRDFVATLDAELYNLYGPTEATVDVSWWRCDTDRSPLAVPIGVPAANTRLYVLDPQHRPVPIGVSGELFIAGVQLARGYVGRPDLTAERFIPDPCHSGERMYRTGVLARHQPNGAIEYLGRIDHQVKLRGLRIELGEIEAALRTLPGVTDAAVLVHHDVLVGYVVTAGGFDVPAAKVALAARLPDYMVPSAYVALAAFPLTSSGKLDRKALPAPELASASAYVAPRDATEEALAEIWRRVLEVERVGVRDDFFAIGGHSLRAMQVTSQVRARFSAELPLRAIFEAPTIEALATRVRALAAQATRPDVTAPLLAAPRGATVPLSYAQQSMWLLQHLEPTSVAYNMASTRWFEGALEIEALRRAVEQLVHRHESLRTRFPAEDGEPRAVIDPPARWDLAYADHGGIDDAKLRELTAQLLAQPFDLAIGPMLRTHLVRVRDDAHLFVLSLH